MSIPENIVEVTAQLDSKFYYDFWANDTYNASYGARFCGMQISYLKSKGIVAHGN